MTTVFRRGEDGHHTFRIPAIVRAYEGTLLAFAEGRRHSAHDSGDIDVVVRRSTDGGRTWSALDVVLAHGTDTAGNPCPVVDPETRDIVLLTTRNGGGISEQEILADEVTADEARRVYVQRSVDNGLTWTTAAEITDDVKAPGWRWYATGPGHAIALRHGVHAGRLVAAANHSTPGEPPHSYGAHALLSDDGGATWRIGAVDSARDGWVDANESTVAELPDGTLLFSARDQHGESPANRAQAYSIDGGQTFETPYAPHTGLTVPIVDGSLLALKDRLLFSSPGDPNERRAMTVHESRDGGATWHVAARVDDRPAAYSDLVALGDDTAGLLYETGDASPYEEIAFLELEV